jgi:hypothetical protein
MSPTEDFLRRLREVARVHGYAIAVHGSAARDLDVVAVPWAPEACSALHLVERICEYMPMAERRVQGVAENPERKPWGRLAWALHGTPDHDYLDLSVAPRAGEPFALTSGALCDSGEGRST